MGKFTYEEYATNSTLETYEWDNIWWEKAPDNNTPRALIIGDSISCGYRQLINTEIGGKIYIDGFGTSKALDNPFMISSIDNVIAQQKHTEAIQINNGLHGWHLSLAEYEHHYRIIIDHILTTYPDVPLIIALTTPVRKKDNLDIFDERNHLVLKRNEIAVNIAKEKNIIINDLYSTIAKTPEIYILDGVHLSVEGYLLLAKQCVKVFKKCING